MSKASKKAIKKLNARLAKVESRSGRTSRVPRKGALRAGPIGKMFNRIKGSEAINVKNHSFAQEFHNDIFDYKDSGFRLGSLFDLYERWFVHSIRFEFVPILPTTATGTLHMCPEYDSTDLLPTSSIVTHMASSVHYRSGSITDSFSMVMPNVRLPSGEYIVNDLFTDPGGSARLSTYGKLVYYTEGVNATGISDGDTVGRIILHYDITFAVPQAPMPIVTTTISSGTGIARITAKDTVEEGPTSEIGSSFLDAASHHLRGVHLTDTAGTTKNVEPESDLMARFKETPMYQYRGKLLSAGTRLFIKMVTKTLDTPSGFATRLISLSEISEIGQVALDYAGAYLLDTWGVSSGDHATLQRLTSITSPS